MQDEKGIRRSKYAEAKKLLGLVRQVLRLEHYAISTDEVCSGWITRYI
jgi:hypothetical protein